jgi:hypothetical protein
MSELFSIQKSVESIQGTLENELTHILGWKSTVNQISKQLATQQGLLNEIHMAVLRSGDAIMRIAVIVIAIAAIAHVVHHW